ncbi:MAG: hypothetical protein K0R51_2559, partial [Cytophagaceae bacterium]|nr:hypothetical protein [Cytophagaceae bacterium]
MSGQTNFCMKAIAIRFAVMLVTMLSVFSAQAQAPFFQYYGTDIALVTPPSANTLLPSTSVPNFAIIDQQLNVRSKSLHLKMDAGDQYQLGNNTWKAELIVAVEFLKGSTILKTVQLSFLVDNNTPEKYHIVEYQDLTNVTSVRIKNLAYVVTNGNFNLVNLNTIIRLSGTWVNDLGLSTASKQGGGIVPSLLTASPVNGVADPLNPSFNKVSKVRLSWTPGPNRSFPSYDLQVLKIEPYQNGDVYINWDQAALIEVNGTSYDMTLAEGTGFYLWRVRPIGSFYEGGRSFYKNLGVWSPSLQNGLVSEGTSGITFFSSPTTPINSGKIINNATVYNDCFYYKQFDEDKNFSYGKVLTEGGRQSEKMTFANGLNQVQQIQTQLFSFNNIKETPVPTTTNVVASQTVYDYLGRPSMQTLPAPLYKNTLGYVSDLFSPQSDPTRTYNASDFDEDLNVYNPAKVSSSSALGKYYSDLNTKNLYVPDAEGYPYTRTTFFNDPLGKKFRQSMPGQTKRIDDSDNSKNTITFFDAVTQDELDLVFGNEAPLDVTAYKEITVDPNKVTSVKYIAYSGEVLATCLDQTIKTDLLPVGNERTVKVKNTFPAGYAQAGDNVSTSIRTLAVTNPVGMTVGLQYQITPNTFGLACGDICQTCDYRIDIEITSQQEPLKRGKNLKISFLVDPTLLVAENCNAPFQPIVWGENKFKEVTYTEPDAIAAEAGFGLSPGVEATSLLLKQGTYIIEKRVYVNNQLTGNTSTYYDIAKQKLLDAAANWTLTQNCCGPLELDLSNYECGKKPDFCEQTTDAFVASSEPAFQDFVNYVIEDLKAEATPSYLNKMTGALISTSLLSTDDEEVGDTDDNNYNELLTGGKVTAFLLELNTHYSCQQISDCYLAASAHLKQNIIQVAMPGSKPAKAATNSDLDLKTNGSTDDEPAPTYIAEFDYLQHAFDCLGYKRGLTAQVYNVFESQSGLLNLSDGPKKKLVETRIDPVLNYTWNIFGEFQKSPSTAVALMHPGNSSPDISFPISFGMRWTGEIDIPTGVTELRFKFNDAARVWIDNSLTTSPLVNCWCLYSNAQGFSWTERQRFMTRNVLVGDNDLAPSSSIPDCNLSNGLPLAYTVVRGRHKIKIEYAQAYADASFVMTWVRSGVEEVVPPHFLYPLSKGCADYTKVITHNQYTYYANPSSITSISNYDPTALYVYLPDVVGGGTSVVENPNANRPRVCVGTYFRDIPKYISSGQQTQLAVYDPALAASIQQAAEKVCNCLNTITPTSADPKVNPITTDVSSASDAACRSGCEDKRAMFEEAINNFVIQANLKAGLLEGDPGRHTFASKFPGLDMCCLVDMMVKDCKDKCNKSNINSYLDVARLKSEFDPLNITPYSAVVPDGIYNFNHYDGTYPFDSYTDFFNSTLFYDLVTQDYNNFTLAFLGGVSVAPVSTGAYTKGADLAYVENQITQAVYAGMDKGLRERKVTNKVSSSLHQAITEYAFVADISTGSTPVNREGKIQVKVSWNPNVLTDKNDDAFISAEINLFVGTTLQEQFVLNQLPAGYFTSGVLTTELNILKFYFDNQHRIHIVPYSHILSSYYTATSHINTSSAEATAKISITGSVSQPDDEIFVSLRTPTGIVDLSNGVLWQSTPIGMALFLAQSINDKKSSPDFIASVSGSDVIVTVPANSHALPLSSYKLIVSGKHPEDYTVDATWTTTSSFIQLLQPGAEKTLAEDCPYSYTKKESGGGQCGNEIDTENYIHVGTNSGLMHADGGYVMTRVFNQDREIEAMSGQASGLFSTIKLPLNTPFSKKYKVNFGKKNQFGADGLLFVIAPNLMTTSDVGHGGGQLGYYNTSNPIGAKGIANSLGIEFDTYVNDVEAHNYGHGGFHDLPPGVSSNFCASTFNPEPGAAHPCSSCTSSTGYCKDVDYDHITVWRNEMGNRYAPSSVPIPTVPIKYSSEVLYNALNVEDGEYHDVSINWSGAPANEFKVYFDEVLRVTIPIANPSTFFNSSDVSFGWLGASVITNDQRIIPLPDEVTPACSLCVRWEKYTAQDVGNVATALGDYPPQIPVTCESAKAEYIATQTQLYLTDCREKKVKELEEVYKTNCLTNIQDEFSITYELGYHHYTLNYYDRAGNLVRTVPPDGVDFLDEPALKDAVKLARKYPNNYAPVLPKHSQVTSYTYNSLKQIISATTPDGGKTSIWYDGKGKQVLKQDAQQLLNGKYTYFQYDEFGRTTEVSQINGFTPAFIDEYEQVLPFNFNLQGLATKEQKIITVYSTPASVSYNGTLPQANLRNRISYTQTQNISGSLITTYYSYDPLGTIEWVIQDLADIGQKSLRYEYNLVSDNVNKVFYQEGKSDQLIHKYTYDEENRIVGVCTSTDNISWTKEANYKYYIHGPLARAEIGHDKIQGVDYTYTIEGYLKAINQVDMQNVAADPGADSPDATTLAGFLKDEFAMELTYHNADYKRTGIPIGVNNTNISSSIVSDFTNLYDGNIAAWSSNTRSATNAANTTTPYGLNIRHLKYDKLNRLKSSVITKDYNATGLLNTVGTNRAAETFVYSGNGNILSTNRWNYSGAQIDQLTYSYLKNTSGALNDAEYMNNRLTKVMDAASTQGSNDLKPGQIDDNYEYDLEGNLTADKQEGITVSWNVYDKIATVYNAKDPNNVRYTVFDYDALGYRVRKTQYNNYGTSSQTGKATVYVRDASGRVMSVYKVVLANSAITWMEAPIYSVGRIGMLRPEKLMVPDVAPPSLTLFKDFQGLDAEVKKSSYTPQGYAIVTNPTTTGINTSSKCAKVTKGWWGDYVIYDLNQYKVDFSKPFTIDFRKEIATNQTIYVWFGDNPNPLYSHNPSKYNQIYAEYTGTITAAANVWQTITFSSPSIKNPYPLMDPTKLKYMYIYVDPTNNTAAAYQKGIWYDNIRLGINEGCNETTIVDSELSTTLVNSLPGKDYTSVTTLFDAEVGAPQVITNLGQTSPWSPGHILMTGKRNHDKEGINQSYWSHIFMRGEDPSSGLTMATASLTTYLPDLSINNKFTMDVMDPSSPTTFTLIAAYHNGTTEVGYATYTAVTTKTKAWQTIEFVPVGTPVSAYKSLVNRLYLYPDRGLSYQPDASSFVILNFESSGISYPSSVAASAGAVYSTAVANPGSSGVNSSALCARVVKSNTGQYVRYLIDNMDIDPNGNVSIDFYKTNATSQNIVVMFGEKDTPDWNDLTNRYKDIRTEFTQTLSTTNTWTKLTFSGPTLRDVTKKAKYMYIFFDPNSSATNQTFYFDNVTPTSLNRTALKDAGQRSYFLDNFLVMPASPLLKPLQGGNTQVFNDGTSFSVQGVAGRAPQQIISGQTAIAESNDGGYAFTFMNTNVFNADLMKGNHGLTAAYYDNSNTLRSTTVVPEINSTWPRAQNPFNSGVVGQVFKVIYTGQVYIADPFGTPSLGSNYTFAVPANFNGVSTLKLDGTDVLWNSVSGFIEVSRNLSVGFHDIEFTVTMTVNNLRSSDVKLLWKTPYDLQKTVINKKHLYLNEVTDAKLAKVDAKHGLITTFYDTNGTSVLQQRPDATVNILYDKNQAVADNVTFNPAYGEGTGLKGEYYNTNNLTGSIVLTKPNEAIDFDWTTNSPQAVTVNNDNFSARWTGYVQPLYSETYTFYVTSDDGNRLYVDNMSVPLSLTPTNVADPADSWADHGPAEYYGTITLIAGKKYNIKVEYAEKGGGAMINLKWSSTSQTKAVIPSTQLYIPTESAPVKPLITNWDGYLYVPIAGTYTFLYTVNVGDTYGLQLDGLALSGWTLTSGKQRTSIYLAQGVHRLNSNYKSSGYQAKCVLEWIQPVNDATSFAYAPFEEVIPSQFLYSQDPTISYLFDQNATDGGIDLVDLDNRIEASEYNQVIAAPIPDTQADYYLITGKNNNIYY